MAESRRKITQDERSMVRWLLEHAATSPDHAKYLETVDTLEVVDRCDCGCPSVDFLKEGQGAGAEILADAVGTATDGLPLNLILWGKEGVISGLEVYNYDGGSWFPLPALQGVRPNGRSSHL